MSDSKIQILYIARNGFIRREGKELASIKKSLMSFAYNNDLTFLSYLDIFWFFVLSGFCG